jgi:EmrB/QacA subfamily drug resistance transporter
MTTRTVTQAPSGPPAEPGRTGRRGWWPLAVIASAHLMAILDVTVMFVALPSAQQVLGLTATTRQWVLTAYTLAFASLLLLGGRLADRLGARRTLLIGIIGFAAASAVGGQSVDGAMLIAARATQGAFAALLVSSTKSLLLSVYTDERRRARAIGVFTATLTAGLAAGLILGGVITSTLGWRWCLYVNVGVSVVAVTGALLVLPVLPGRPEVKLDVASALLAGGGMVALVFGLAQAPAYGWHSGEVIGALVAAAGLLAGFFARQSHTVSALLPPRVVHERNRGGALIAMVVNSLSTFGLMLILTFQLQAVLHYSALATGLTLLPFAVAASAGAAVIAPRLTLRIRPRWIVTAGLVLSAAGLLPLAGLVAGHAGRNLVLIIAAEVIEGLGTGIGGPPALATALRGVLSSDRGAASAASSAAGQLGSSVGAALLNTVAITATAGYLAGRIGPIGRVGSAASAVAGGRAALVAAATVHGYVVAAVVGAALLLVAVIPVAVLINAPALPRKG